jgi:polysaccharide deacetylase family protein (PEP-CTERM system associated)
MQMKVSSRPAHHFTVDVEEHFQVSALEPYVERSAWDQLESRVERSTRRILDLLDQYQAPGTFFVLGWIAERYPVLVKEIAARGHEIASHGTDHQRVTQLNPESFRVSVRDSKQILEQLVGEAVIGYRAPSFSIVPGREWALDILAEVGYAYDSSLYPVRRKGYGYPGTPISPHVLERAAGTLMEFPPATFRALGATLPAGGGAYIRLLPKGLVETALRQAEAAGYGGTFYIHPWEIDAEQPRFAVPALTRVRHYGRLGRTYRRLEDLLKNYRFQTMAQTMADLLATSGAPRGGQSTRQQR